MRTYDVDKWAKFLGWPKPRRRRHLADGHGPIIWFESGVWYEAGLLQINRLPVLRGCAFALDFQTCSGFVPLDTELIDDGAYRESISDWLHQRHFATAAGAETYAQMHPECAGQTWGTIRERGYPYRIEWVEASTGHGSFQRIKLGCSPQ